MLSWVAGGVRSSNAPISIILYIHFMPEYRRSRVQGGVYFFTVATFERVKIFAQEPTIRLLRRAFWSVIIRHPFKIEAAVNLPDHLHMLWRMPEDDSNYPTRWRLIKSYFTHYWEGRDDYPVPASRQRKGKRSVWQRRHNTSIGSTGDDA